MTKRDIGIAVVVGSQIIGLLKTMPIEEQTKGMGKQRFCVA